MKVLYNKIIVISVLIILTACSSTQINSDFTKEQEIMLVVNGYENALKEYDSNTAISFLDKKLITNSYKNEANYHKVIKNAFAAIKRDGGIISTEKWNLIIKGDSATVKSRIVTKYAQQEGTIELKRIKDIWVIIKVP